MRRFALVLVVVGSVLLGVTVVVASRPDRAPARVVRARQVVFAPHAAVLRVSPAPGARPVPLAPLPMPRALAVGPHIKRPYSVPTMPRAPSGSCDVAAGDCSLHPCVTYAGAATQTAVLRSASGVAVLPQPVARPRPAPTQIVPIPAGPSPATPPCVASAPAQRLVSTR